MYIYSQVPLYLVQHDMILYTVLEFALTKDTPCLALETCNRVSVVWILKKIDHIQCLALIYVVIRRHIMMGEQGLRL